LKEERLQEIVQSLRAARRAGAEMHALLLLARNEHGLDLLNESEVWKLLSYAVVDREDWASRDPGRQHKYGKKGRRAKRKKKTWFQYIVAERRGAARSRPITIVVDSGGLPIIEAEIGDGLPIIEAEISSSRRPRPRRPQ
jgi:hypothetical protein